MYINYTLDLNDLTTFSNTDEVKGSEIFNDCLLPPNILTSWPSTHSTVDWPHPSVHSPWPSYWRPTLDPQSQERVVKLDYDRLSLPPLLPSTLLAVPHLINNLIHPSLDFFFLASISPFQDSSQNQDVHKPQAKMNNIVRQPLFMVRCNKDNFHKQMEVNTLRIMVSRISIHQIS